MNLKTGGVHDGLQDYAEDIVLSCPTRGAQDVLSRKSSLHRKNGGFSDAIIVSMGKHDRPAIGKKGCARQITSALTATIQLWLHRGIIHFFKEATIWQEKKAPLGAKCVSG